MLRWTLLESSRVWQEAGEGYKLKNGRTFADYAHATNCNRWHGWSRSCQGHDCTGRVMSSFDLDELIDIVKGLQVPGVIGSQRPLVKLDCSAVLDVKEEEGNMPGDPFPTAVSYIDENAEADVVLALRDAPPLTCLVNAVSPQLADEGLPVERATELAHEGNSLLEGHGATLKTDSSEVAQSEASFVSAAGDQLCFLEGTMLSDADGRLVRVEDLQLHHGIRAADGQVIHVAGVKRHAGPHHIVTLQCDDHVLRMTASHRVMVQRGKQQEPAPAKDLRAGEDVVRRFGTFSLPTMPVVTEEDIPAIELIFKPNLLVETFPAPSENAVLTMGNRPPKRRRGRHVAGDIDMLSIPATDDGFQDHV